MALKAIPAVVCFTAFMEFISYMLHEENLQVFLKGSFWILKVPEAYGEDLQCLKDFSRQSCESLKETSRGSRADVYPRVA